MALGALGDVFAKLLQHAYCNRDGYLYFYLCQTHCFPQGIQPSMLAPIGQKTVVADAHKAFGKDMHFKPAHKLLFIEYHAFGFVAICIIFVAKTNRSIFYRFYLVAGDGCLEGVPSQVPDHLIRSSERSFSTCLCWQAGTLSIAYSLILL